MSNVQEAYEQTSYPHYVHPLTDPARLAALGSLLGLNVARPSHARVLDIGCGSGTDLLAMAERLPGSEFLGIDFIAAEIESARALAAEARLDNVRFEKADLLEWTPSSEQYDYIIAYGFFSWVPDAVKDRLFEICRQCLAPNGIACISYMTYPGCKQPESLRDLLLLRTQGCDSRQAKIANSQQVLEFLEQTLEKLPNLAHSSHVRAQVQEIRRKEPHFLLLDDLGVERDPCYLIEFANWAAEHNLKYVGESEFHTMFAENLPQESAMELGSMRLDRLETEQMLDFVVNRSFRCSLLAHAEAVLNEGLNVKSLDGLCFKPVLAPDGSPEQSFESGRFRTREGASVELRSEPLTAFCRTLAVRPHSFTPFPSALATAQDLVERKFTEAEVSRLREDLLSLLVRRQIEVSSLAFAPLKKLPLHPRLTAVNYATARSRSMLVTAKHEAYRITEGERGLCKLLDGTHTLQDLLAVESGSRGSASVENFLNSLRVTGCLESER